MENSTVLQIAPLVITTIVWILIELLNEKIPHRRLHRHPVWNQPMLAAWVFKILGLASYFVTYLVIASIIAWRAGVPLRDIVVVYPFAPSTTQFDTIDLSKIGAFILAVLAAFILARVSHDYAIIDGKEKVWWREPTVIAGLCAGATVICYWIFDRVMFMLLDSLGVTPIHLNLTHITVIPYPVVFTILGVCLGIIIFVKLKSRQKPVASLPRRRLIRKVPTQLDRD